MNVAEFRRSLPLTQRMRELLSDPVMTQALEVLAQSNPPVDAEPRDDALASVRILSQMTGYHIALTTLSSLSRPLPEPVELVAEYKPEIP